MIRLLSICSLGALYLALTLNALTCGLHHGLSPSGDAMPCALHGGQDSPPAHLAGMDHSGGMDRSHGTDHSHGSDSMVLCACLDNLTAAGVALTAPALRPPDLPRPVTGYARQARSQEVFSLPPSRGPPASRA